MDLHIDSDELPSLGLMDLTPLSLDFLIFKTILNSSSPTHGGMFQESPWMFGTIDSTNPKY